MVLNRSINPIPYDPEQAPTTPVAPEQAPTTLVATPQLTKEQQKLWLDMVVANIQEIYADKIDQKKISRIAGQLIMLDFPSRKVAESPERLDEQICCNTLLDTSCLKVLFQLVDLTQPSEAAILRDLQARLELISNLTSNWITPLGAEQIGAYIEERSAELLYELQSDPYLPPKANIEVNVLANLFRLCYQLEGVDTYLILEEYWKGFRLDVLEEPRTYLSAAIFRSFLRNNSRIHQTLDLWFCDGRSEVKKMLSLCLWDLLNEKSIQDLGLSSDYVSELIFDAVIYIRPNTFTLTKDELQAIKQKILAELAREQAVTPDAMDLLDGIGSPLLTVCFSGNQLLCGQYFIKKEALIASYGLGYQASLRRRFTLCEREWIEKKQTINTLEQMNNLVEDLVYPRL